MAIVVTFASSSMNADQYDEALRRLEAAGMVSPPGRLHHTCYGTGSNLRVTDIWESEEAMGGSFQQTLMPILQELGIDPGQPEVYPLYKSIP